MARAISREAPDDAPTLPSPLLVPFFGEVLIVDDADADGRFRFAADRSRRDFDGAANISIY